MKSQNVVNRRGHHIKSNAASLDTQSVIQHDNKTVGPTRGETAAAAAAMS